MCIRDSLRKEDAEAHDVLLCIQTGKTIDDENRMRYEPRNFYLRSEEEMAALFAGCLLYTSRNALIAELALSHPLHLLAVAYFHAICRHNWYHNRKVLKMQVKFSKKHKLFSTVRQGGVSAPPLPRQIQMCIRDRPPPGWP